MNFKINKVKIKTNICLYYVKGRKTLFRKLHKGNAKVIKKKTERFKSIKKLKTINKKEMRNDKLKYLLHKRDTIINIKEMLQI